MNSATRFTGGVAECELSNAVFTSINRGTSGLYHRWPISFCYSSNYMYMYMYKRVNLPGHVPKWPMYMYCYQPDMLPRLQHILLLASYPSALNREKVRFSRF